MLEKPPSLKLLILSKMYLKKNQIYFSHFLKISKYKFFKILYIFQIERLTIFKMLLFMFMYLTCPEIRHNSIKDYI
jgi:hypothetical protein